MPIGTGSELNLISFIFAVFFASTLTAAENKPVLHFETEFIWHESASWFGGLSGLELSPDGQRMTIITDRGHVLQASIQREAGQITAAKITHSVAMRDATGSILRRPFTDAEGLAIAPDGTHSVSFEGQHRIATLNIKDGVTTPIARLSASEFQAENSGFEALAIDKNGTIFAIAEQTKGDHFPLFAFKDGTQTIAAQIPRNGPFLPVGADFGANGRLYVLERAVTPLGFRTRIRRIDLDTATPHSVTLIQTLPARFDNLEAISVWEDASGRTRLTLVSDDNFMPFQNTQIIEFSVID
ncbi:hypothetical protein SAMN04488040_2236 [Sulfitobacter marinus]|uniref:Phytase-like domain-containing protein n=1 Tax=Sulfitobacter marinus TaxID=394264 RepID=A0A1I6TFS5_9RHOB|nr:esterase-like activity of phytase family protein [Sulfitobacter marinus]SFS88041.1 hypothetical protein SAMN04488040_2236 [Sulfitobacter marinus]